LALRQASVGSDRRSPRRDPEYQVILRIGSGLHSNFKFAPNDRNGDPLEGHRSDPFLILYYQIALDDKDLQLLFLSDLINILLPMLLLPLDVMLFLSNKFNKAKKENHF
jgi:hypothetical protein